MSTVRVVYREDGGVHIIHPAPNVCKEGETEMEWLERVFTKAMCGDLEGRPYDDIDDSELPQSREYRNAWTGSKGNGISINAIKKVEIDEDKNKLSDKEKIEALEAEVLKLRDLIKVT